MTKVECECVDGERRHFGCYESRTWKNKLGTLVNRITYCSGRGYIEDDRSVGEARTYGVLEAVVFVNGAAVKYEFTRDST